MMQFEFESEVWQWDARTDAAWYFLSLPEPAAADISDMPRPPRGFGSVRVDVRIGGSRWQTSIFPDATQGTYVLPLKRRVRDAEGIGLGDLVRVTVEILG